MKYVATILFIICVLATATMGQNIEVPVVKKPATNTTPTKPKTVKTTTKQVNNKTTNKQKTPTKKQPANPKPADRSYGEWVDLGLPSLTLWKNSNENGFYSYDDAIAKFGSRLPTKEQLKELKDKCKWTCNSSRKGYNVVGPNGNSIFLPAAGRRDCGGNENRVGSGGIYWSSTPSGSDAA